MEAQLKKHKDSIEINVFQNKSRRRAKSSYNNLLTKDPNRIAQVLIDLMVLGFPIEKAIVIVTNRLKRHDWMGV